MYLIQALGLSLNHGKWGVWILEVFCAAFSFEIIYRCGRYLNLNVLTNCLSILIVSLFYFIYLEGGNTCEEWSVPFQLLALLVFIRYMKTQHSQLLKANKPRTIESKINLNPNDVRLPAFIMGLCFGIVALIRINNNCLICGLVLGLTILFIYRAQYKSLWQSILFFLIGVVIAFIPFVIYFAYHNALYDMIYSNYIFNFHYKFFWKGSSLFKESLIMVSPTFILPFISYLYDRRYKTNFLLPFTIAALISFFVFFYGARYPHYFLMLVPIVALSIQLSSKINWFVNLIVGLYLLMPVYIFKERIKTTLNNSSFTIQDDYNPYYKRLVYTIKEIIPENEFDSIYVNDDFSTSKLLITLGHFPVSKYFFLQSSLKDVDNYIKEDIREDFIESNPLWVISSTDFRNNNSIISDIILKGYYKYNLENDSLLVDKYYLYRRYKYLTHE